MTPTVSIEPRMLDQAAAARFCGLSVRRFAAAVHDRTLPSPVQIAGANVWHVEQLRDALDRLAQWSDTPPGESRAAQRVRERMPR